MKKKLYAATGRPYEKKSILEIERRSTRSPSMKNSLWTKVWICRKTDKRTNGYIQFVPHRKWPLRGILHASCQGMDPKYFEDITLTTLAAFNSYRLACHKYSYISQSRIW